MPLQSDQKMKRGRKKKYFNDVDRKEAKRRQQQEWRQRQKEVKSPDPKPQRFHEKVEAIEQRIIIIRGRVKRQKEVESPVPKPQRFHEKVEAIEQRFRRIAAAPIVPATRIAVGPFIMWNLTKVDDEEPNEEPTALEEEVFIKEDPCYDFTPDDEQPTTSVPPVKEASEVSEIKEEVTLVKEASEVSEIKEEVVDELQNNDTEDVQPVQQVYVEVGHELIEKEDELPNMSVECSSEDEMEIKHEVLGKEDFKNVSDEEDEMNKPASVPLVHQVYIVGPDNPPNEKARRPRKYLDQSKNDFNEDNTLTTSYPDPLEVNEVKEVTVVNVGQCVMKEITDEATNSSTYQCLLCEKTFSEFHVFKYHVILKHPCVCKYCLILFESNKLHEQHEAGCTGTLTVRRWTDYQPVKTPASTKQLEQLIKQQIKEEKKKKLKYKRRQRPKKQCPICGDYFERNSLELHQIKVHGKQKRFQCGVCEKLFARLDGLNKHEELHAQLPWHLRGPPKACYKKKNKEESEDEPTIKRERRF